MLSDCVDFFFEGAVHLRLARPQPGLPLRVAGRVVLVVPARWCSMAICGNRMKARRHYSRARSAQADQDGFKMQLRGSGADAGPNRNTAR